MKKKRDYETREPRGEFLPIYRGISDIERALGILPQNSTAKDPLTYEGLNERIGAISLFCQKYLHNKESLARERRLSISLRDSDEEINYLVKRHKPNRRKKSYDTTFKHRHAR